MRTTVRFSLSLAFAIAASPALATSDESESSMAADEPAATMQDQTYLTPNEGAETRASFQPDLAAPETKSEAKSTPAAAAEPAAAFTDQG